MSRVKRLKKAKRKTIVKATVCGLALSLSIASLQGLGTYAIFRDVEKIPSNLSMSTGDVDVEIIGDGFKNIELENGKEYENDFDILNNGTLDQKLYLGFDYKGSKSPKGITYRLEIKYNDKVIDNIVKMGEELQSQDKIEIKDNGNDFILKAGEKLTCKAYVKLDSTVYDDLKEADNFNFDLKVISSQIGFKDIGFYDIATQTNELSAAKKNENEEEFEAVLGKCKCCGLPAIIFNYPEEFKDKDKNVDISLPFEDNNEGFSAHYNYEKGKISLVKRNQYEFPLTEKDILREKGFTVDFVIGEGKYQRYILTFKKVDENFVGKWTKDRIITSNEPQNNKVQAPDKPQAAESSKEEVKVPVKPEVVESTKGEDKEQQGNAQEEQSQKEEVKAQGESQEVESSKEEVEVPKKSDVVNP